MKKNDNNSGYNLNGTNPYQPNNNGYSQGQNDNRYMLNGQPYNPQGNSYYDPSQYSQNTDPQQSQYNSYYSSMGNPYYAGGSVAGTKPKKKKTAVIVTIIILLFVGIIVGAVVFVFGLINGLQTEEEYTVGQHSVPSIYSVIGERKVASFSSKSENGDEIKTYNYDYTSYSHDKMIAEIDEYAKYLSDNEGFLIERSDNYYDGKAHSYLLAYQADDDVIIVFDVYENNFKLNITNSFDLAKEVI